MEPTKAQPWRTGEHIDGEASARQSASKYQVITELGHGGMADVFLAVARGPAGFSKLTVLKQLREDSAKDSRFLDMLLDEARLAALLNHPNIVQTNEVGVDDAGRFFIAMEHLEGQSLAKLLQRLHDTQRELPLPVALRIAAGALAGLHYAHELVDFAGKRLEVVHCDLSPHNLFVTYAGQVKLLDFGLARAKSNATQALSGELRGKLYYMAPEQAVAQPVDRRSDIFAMGVVLWEMLTGHQLWRGQTDIAVACNLRFGEIPRLASAAPQLPQSLASVCQKALAFRAEERYATAMEFQVALERVQDELSLRASAEDVGALVGEQFSEERNAVRGLVESHMAQRIAADEAREAEALVAGRPTAPLRTVSAATPSSRRLYPVALAAVVVAIAVGVMLKPEAVPAPAPGASVTRHARPAPPSAIVARPAPIPVEIRVRTENAQIFWDDLPLRGNPFRGQFAPDAQVHRVRAEAAGYRSQTVVVTLDRELALDLTLEPEPSSAIATTAQRPDRSKRKALGTAPSVKISTPPDQAPEAPSVFEDPWGGR